jgi:hypothetical protein
MKATQISIWSARALATTKERPIEWRVAPTRWEAALYQGHQKTPMEIGLRHCFTAHVSLGEDDYNNYGSKTRWRIVATHGARECREKKRRDGGKPRAKHLKCIMNS